MCMCERMKHYEYFGVRCNVQLDSQERKMEMFSDKLLSRNELNCKVKELDNHRKTQQKKKRTGRLGEIIDQFVWLVKRPRTGEATFQTRSAKDRRGNWSD